MSNINDLLGIADIGLVTTILNLNLKNYEINKKLLEESIKNNNKIYDVLKDILLELEKINNKLG